MQQFQDIAQDTYGNVQAGLSITIKTYPGGATATIYSDDGVTPAANPLTTGSDGLFSFYAANGTYTVEYDGEVQRRIKLFDQSNGLAAADVSTITANSSSAALTITNSGSGNALASSKPIKVNESLWPTLAADGANWGMRDSWIAGMGTAGKIGVAGFAKSSQSTNSAYAPIGTAGFCIHDNAAEGGGWSFYGDMQYSAGDYAYGLELAIKNKSGVDATSTPYFATNGTYGIWLPAGGDSSYGGAATNNNNTGIAFGGIGGITWNRGIVFYSNALTGSDGTTGNSATAIEMAKGQAINWRGPSNIQAATIRSDVSTSDNDVGLVFTNSIIAFFGASSAPLVYMQHTAGSTSVSGNYLSLKNSTTGNPVVVEALGTDTNRSLQLKTAGTGSVLLTAGATANSGTAIPAGGSQSVGYKLTSTANFGVFAGSGAPTLSAAKGSLYLRSDGSGTNDRMYVNTDGGTTWTAVVTVA